MTWSAKDIRLRHVVVVGRAVGVPVGLWETVGEFVGARVGAAEVDGRLLGAPDVVGARVGGQLLLSLLSRMVVSELRHPPLMVSPLFTRAPSSFSV